jgi:hypothetical protein
MISKLTLGLVTLVATLALAVDATAQDPSHRFGKWQMDSDNPPPFVNIMTYEAWGDGGMAITVESTNARGQDNAWGYNTTFDGEFREVWGQENAETAVEWVNERTTRISNMRNGRVTQVIINTLSEDGNTINNEYVRLDEDGKITGVGHAVYRRISQ